MSDYYPRPKVYDPVEIIDEQRHFYTAGYAFLERLGLTALVHGTVTDDTIAWSRLLPEEVQQGAVSTARDLQPMLLWREERQVYVVHPAVTRSLSSLKSTTKIPGATLRKLRHPNPFFILPNGVEMTHADGHPGRTIGFYITGAVSGRYLLDPAVSRAVKGDGRDMQANESILRNTGYRGINAYHALVISEVLDDDGEKVIDHDFSRITIPIQDEFTLDSLVDDIVDGFLWGPEIKGTLTAERKTAYMRSHTFTVIAHLLYAVSKSAEIAEPRGQHKRKKNKGKPIPEQRRKRGDILPVGFRMGAAIEAKAGRYENWTSDPRTGTRTSRKVAPHIRAAHPHIYRIGPGRQEIDVKWLDLIHVNEHLDDGETVTVRKVK